MAAVQRFERTPDGEGAVSSLGYVVRRGPRGALIYADGGRRLVVRSEPGVNRWFFFMQELRWDGEHAALPRDELFSISERVANALRHLDVRFRLELPDGRTIEG